jgi:hypothetical protein
MRACSWLLLALALAGCGDHYSTQAATARCNQERRTKATVDDDSFKECVACYEDCGADCKPQAQAPETYLCPE